MTYNATFNESGDTEVGDFCFSKTFVNTTTRFKHKKIPLKG